MIHPPKLLARAFTLIELLIVVAIIAILAAIAVPNFLEAQTRSKVSRTLADMRTMRTGIESYRVDNTKYPETDRGIQIKDNNGLLSFFRLTTPIAYLTSVPSSPWNENYGTGNPANPKIAQEVESYLYVRKLADSAPGSPTGPGAFSDVNLDYMTDRYVYLIAPDLAGPEPRTRGEWLLKSAGPNGEDDRFVRGNNARLYDPTNGTVSDGDIVIFSDRSSLRD